MYVDGGVSNRERFSKIINYIVDYSSRCQRETNNFVGVDISCLQFK